MKAGAPGPAVKISIFEIYIDTGTRHNILRVGVGWTFIGWKGSTLMSSLMSGNELSLLSWIKVQFFGICSPERKVKRCLILSNCAFLYLAICYYLNNRAK